MGWPGVVGPERGAFRGIVCILEEVSTSVESDHHFFGPGAARAASLGAIGGLDTNEYSQTLSVVLCLQVSTNTTARKHQKLK